ncbi:MAG TPA: helix-turn-helix domain-containing protein [Candidatus Eisenbacteria bacterium]|nr:helix-turn-helix domain-containing protein [Candidatus Eisenbacteria bacterium]
MNPPRQKRYFTISEAAKKLRVTRAAIHQAIRKGKLEAHWGIVTQVIEKPALQIVAEDLAQYRVDLSRQERGKKIDLA